MNHSTPGLPVHHQLPEFTQTRVHQVGDATQPSHSLSSPSPPAMVKANGLGPLKCTLDFPIYQLLPIPGILLKRYFLLSYMSKSSLCSKGQF